MGLERGGEKKGEKKYWSHVVVGRVVDDDPVAHVLVLSRLVGDWNGA